MKNNKGITLIALVITIIVLLILAGVAIAMLSGDNGVLTRASDSKVANFIGAKKDEVNMAAAEGITEFYEKKYVTEDLTAADTVQALVETKITAVKIETEKDTKEDITVTLNTTGAEHTVVISSKSKPELNSTGTIHEDGKITWVDKFKK